MKKNYIKVKNIKLLAIKHMGIFLGEKYVNAAKFHNRFHTVKATLTLIFIELDDAVTILYVTIHFDLAGKS
jgi:hypothetical protein